MKVIFFDVDNVLNFPESEALAPSGAKGVADSRVKELRNLMNETGSRIVLTGKWIADWDFDDKKCTPDGTYLNKKLNKKGLHILDKVNPGDKQQAINEWLEKRSNVTEWCVLESFDDIKWVTKDG